MSLWVYGFMVCGLWVYWFMGLLFYGFIVLWVHGSGYRDWGS